MAVCNGTLFGAQLLFFMYLQDKKSQGPLKGRDKELMWRELLKEILPGPSFFITLPPDIDFDAAESEMEGKGNLYVAA